MQIFREVLQEVFSTANLHPTFSDPRRRLHYPEYLSLLLFGLINPVVESMRGLCAITQLERVRKEISGASVSLGSFSAAQHVIDPNLLKLVFGKMVERMPSSVPRDARLAHLKLIAQDGSLWRALPRMAWAEYGVGPDGQAKGVRLHLRFNILEGQPCDALLTPGNGSETRALRQMLKPGETTVGDRGYGKDYQVFGDIDAAEAFFVCRIMDGAVINVEEELPLSEAEKAAGIVRHAWVKLGATEKLRSMRLRLVEVRRDGQHLLLVTNHPVERVPAELVSLIYRRRWSIELFFRWVKCILGSRHLLAESPEGVAIQFYLMLIGALLLQLYSGRRPSKRELELMQFYFLGWVSPEELATLLQKASAPKKTRKKAA